MRAHASVRLARVFLVVLVLAGFIPAAGAATRAYYFKPLGSELGLTQNSVGAMAQDAQGFIWLGTQGGLNRYDGSRFRAYRHDPRDPGTLPDSFVTALASTADALWVGTYSQYVARLDLRTGSIRRYANSAPDRRADREVLALQVQGTTVWVGTVSGLDRLDAASGRRSRVLNLPASTAAAPNQQLLRVRDGSLWYATGVGLFHLVDGRAQRVGASPAYALAEDSRGRLWVGGDRGVAQFTGARLVPTWPRAGESAESTQVRALAAAPDGGLWISSFPDGLRRLDPATGDVRAVHEDRNLPGALPEDSINSLLVDRGGMLWVGGQFRGAAVSDPRGSLFSFVTNGENGHARGAADGSIRTVTGTPGAIWLGTDGDRFLRYDLATGRFDDRTASLPAPVGRIAAFAPRDANSLWLATASGLRTLDPSTGQVTAVPLDRPVEYSLRSIARGAAGDIWLGTSGEGAVHFFPSSGRVEHVGANPLDAQHLSHPNVHAVLVDRRGRVWFGTGDGLDVRDPATGAIQHFRTAPTRADSLPSNVIRALYQDSAGRVWVGTQAGLSQAIERRGTDGTVEIGFDHPLDRALPERTTLIVFSLREAPAGVLWAGTDAGLLRYQPALRRARLFGLGDGVQDLEFNGGAAGTLADGRIALGGVRGINLIDPTRASDDAYAAPVRLLRARIGSHAAEGDLWQPASLAVPAGADLLRVQVGALDFAPSAGTRYRYRMDGLDADWIDNGGQQDITYTHLPPGSYQLHVQATDRSGRWSPGELVLPVRVATPLWRSPLVLLLLAALLIGPLMIALWQWRKRRRGDKEHIRTLGEREERLKLALWASGEQFWDYDLRDHSMRRMRPRDPEGDARAIGTDEVTEQLHPIHPDDLERVLAQVRRHVKGETPEFESQHRVATPEGDWIWVRARGRVVERDDTGRALRMAGTARDITANRRAERDRRVASEVLRSMAEAVAVFDDDFNFISVNPAFTRMTGYSQTEVEGEPTRLIDSRQHDASVYQSMRDELRRNGRWSGELWQRRKDGGEFLCLLQASVVLDNAGQRGHWVGVLADVTDQKRAEQELRYLANYDTLTGLPNRALLSERLSRAIARARRQNTRIALLFLDLDRFKDINDSLGHAAGDAILRATAGRLQQAVGSHHTVSRLGGDEFTVVLEHVGDPSEAEDCARELLTAFEQPLDAGDLRDITISPSIGIALFPDHADTPSDLLKHADTAMYQAKAIGRRTFMRYTGTMDVDIRRRATLSAALRKVIDRDELQIMYQPKMSASGHRLTGVEALLRWNSSEFGPVSPVQFIPLAEESGLILEIGEWVLRGACEQVAKWRADGIDTSVAVNVSALQLRRGNLAALIEQTLQTTGVPASCLELELTESVVMAEETWSAMHAIRLLGVRMAIDDFGTGYSSLAYLKRLPIQTLKIDKEFIADLTRDPDDEAITSAVIAMGHSLGLNVLAEGVETAGQLDFLRRHGIDEIQGYWLARPMDALQCRAFFDEWTKKHTLDAAGIDR